MAGDRGRAARVIKGGSWGRPTHFRSAGLALLREHLLTASKSGLRGRVKLVVDVDEVIDARPVGEALRNVVFHGDFTQGGAGLTRSVVARAQTRTQRLSQAVLDTVEADFEAWVTAT